MAVIALLFLVLGLAGCGAATHGSGSPESPGSENLRQVPRWVEEEGLPQRAVPGAQLFAQSGCLLCHTYLGSGERNLGAPDLTVKGVKHKGIRFQIAHLKCPSCVSPGSPMPRFQDLGRANLRRLAIFLEASTGRK